MLTQNLKRVIICVLTLLLGGCANLHLPSQTSQFSKKSRAKRIQELNAITAWNIQGAFSFQNKNKTNIANYFWNQIDLKDYIIRIQSSLNLYSVVITATNGRVTLSESNHSPLTAQSPEALMQERLGFSLPVSYLFYWIRGLPAAELTSSYTELDTYNHLTQLIQQGWQIHFSHYVSVNHVDLPSLLEIQGHGQKIKIVVKNWVNRK